MYRHTRNRLHNAAQPAAFSLVELVLVIAIIGIVAAIAVPRISRAGSHADARAVLATLSNVRAAIDRYYAEHGSYPGYNPATGIASGVHFARQLTRYSDAAGNTEFQPGGDFVFGPYLGKPFPTNPFNGRANTRVKEDHSGTLGLDISGWIAVRSDGSFSLNAESAALPTDVFTEFERTLVDDLRLGR